MATPAGRLVGYREGNDIAVPLPGSTLQQAPEGAERIAFAGGGQIMTYTVVHVAAPRFKPRTPYALAVVELDEGTRLLAMIDGATGEDLAVGARVMYSGGDEFGHHFLLSR